MVRPTFLEMDSAWRVLPISWGADFNAQLAQAATSAPAPITPFSSERAEPYRRANTNALRLLDSRQIDANGQLPMSICGMAFGGWSEAEASLIKEHTQHGNQSYRGEDFAFLDDLFFAWRCVIKFNLATLALIDADAPPFMRQMVPGQLNQTVSWLDQAIGVEDALESQLGGLPCPTKQVRIAVQKAMGHLPESPLRNLFD